MPESKKCECGLDNHLFCPNCSKVKLVILLKNGNNELKIGTGAGAKNPVWYSYLKYNRYNVDRIAEKMRDRILKETMYAGKIQVLQFYENKPGQTYFKKLKLC